MQVYSSVTIRPVVVGRYGVSGYGECVYGVADPKSWTEVRS